MTLDVILPVTAITVLLALLTHILVRRRRRLGSECNEISPVASEAAVGEESPPPSIEASGEMVASMAPAQVTPPDSIARIVAREDLARGSATDDPAPGDPEPSAEGKDHEAFLSDLETRCAASEDLATALITAAQTVRSHWHAPAVAVWTQSRSAAIQEGPAYVPSLFLRHDLDLLSTGGDGPVELSEVFRPWGDALWNGEAVCIPDTTAEPDLIDRLRPHCGALVLIPLRCTPVTLAVMAVAWPTALEIQADEMVEMRRLAATLGRATERLALRQELQYRRMQDRVLLHVAGALVHASDLDTTLRSIVATVQEGLGYRNCALLLLDDEQGDLYVASQVGYRESVGSLRLPLDGPAITATAARLRCTQNVPDVYGWPGYVAGSEEIRSEIAFPLIVEERVLGVLDIESEESDAFDPQAQAILEAVASEAALVLSHSELVARLEKRASQLQAVDGLARSVGATIEPQTILESVVQEVRSAVSCDCAAVIRFDDRRRSGRVMACAGALQDEMSRQIEFEFSGDPESEIAALGGKASYVPDLDPEAGEIARWLSSHGLHSVYRVPVIVEGVVNAVVIAVSATPRAFSPTQLSVLEALAPHIAAAVRNAGLYEELRVSYEKLGEAQEELVSAEQFRALGEMTSGLAHKFNNLLGAILGRVQVAVRRAGDSELRTDLGIIEGAAQDGANTIRQLQRFTGVHADRKFAPVDLSTIVNRVLSGCPEAWRPGRDAEDEDHIVRVMLDDESWVSGLSQELEEVVSHTVNNAIEAMPSGGTLTIETSLSEGQVTLEVSDTGAGMSEEARSRIFHPFFTTKGPRSLGLGLSIAFGIVRRHGGSLEVESEPGKGTTVRLALPAGQPGEIEQFEPPARRIAAAGGRILVVEDEPVVADLLGEILITSGHEVSVVNSATEAVQQLAEGGFDVLLTDIGLPQMSGWELARHCRDLHAGLPVILVTGWGLEVDDDMIADSGVCGVVAKPFQVDDIVTAVAKALGRGAEESEAA
jgi:signal transduction histidine kinase/ActR/RegA family two-component response regulator